MTARFILLHAMREARGATRRIGPYLLSITLGVGALVAIHSVRAAVVDGVNTQARELLGGDARLGASAPFPPPVRALIDSLRRQGVRVAETTTLPSMVLGPGGGVTRLLQVRAVTADYPLVGAGDATPPDAWRWLHAGGAALPEPAALLQLGAEAGDTLSIGFTRVRVVGSVADDAAPEGGFRSALGPRIYIAERDLPATGLLVVGSLARYEALLAVPAGFDLDGFEAAHDSLFHASRVGFDTADERARSLARGLEDLSRFLGLIGLAALLLGGIGVASAIGVFTREKVPTIAVLRCLGATSRDVFLAYLAQAALLGLVGALAGVALGIAAEPVLVAGLRSSLPVHASFAVDPGAVIAGVLTGLWVAVMFALIPLLDVRGVSPLQALRREYGSGRATLRARLIAYAALALSVVALSLWQAPNAGIGFAFAAAISAAVALLWALALGLVRAVRRFFPRRARYPVRQGIANLFRPRNQTVAVTLALGFGVFVIAALFVVQQSLLEELRIDPGTGRPNLLLFDVQRDQGEGVRSLLAEHGVELRQLTPVVPSRIAALRGRTADEWLADTSEAAPEHWALRREYRNTYRDTMTSAETLVSGHWWSSAARNGAAPLLSLDADVAEELGVGIGDTIIWDVQGVRIASVIGSLRKVDWTRFEPNFFAVFQPGALEQAPQMLVGLASVPNDTMRARVQVALVSRFPNVSILDLDRVQKVIARITSRVATAVRVVGLLAIIAGLIVLFGAVGTTRQQRLRESALLKALGADRARIRTILLTEYLALGVLAAVAGALLGLAAGVALTTGFFHLELQLPAARLVGLAVAVVALTAGVGVMGSRGVLSRPPLAVLREAAE